MMSPGWTTELAARSHCPILAPKEGQETLSSLAVLSVNMAVGKVGLPKVSFSMSSPQPSMSSTVDWAIEATHRNDQQ